MLFQPLELLFLNLRPSSDQIDVIENDRLRREMSILLFMR